MGRLCLRRRGYTYDAIVSMDIIILSRLTMSVKQEVIDIKGEENEVDEPQYPCPMFTLHSSHSHSH